MESVRIVSMCVVSAVLYGIAHDQVTARICVEYFTIGHPPVFGTEDPTLLGLGWGVLATWWVGALLGVPLSVAARVGSRPKRNVRSLVLPVVSLMGITALGALFAGVAGWTLARNGIVFLMDPLASRIPAGRRVPFLVDLWAHSASYLVGFVGGIVVIVRVWRSRGRAAVAGSPA